MHSYKHVALVLMIITMIYSHNSSTYSSSYWAKEASYRMFSLLKTYPNIIANIADSILDKVTDALVPFTS